MGKRARSAWLEGGVGDTAPPSDLVDVFVEAGEQLGFGHAALGHGVAFAQDEGVYSLVSGSKPSVASESKR